MITHPEKILFPDDGITKGDVAAYYEALAPVIVPHLVGRPITMERYPSGIGEQGFWQKDVSRGFPAWLQRVEVPKKDGVVHHPLVTDTRSLLWITNQNTITQHVWTSRTPRLEYPDLCVFDLDPPAAGSSEIRAAAIELRDLLAELSLPSWVKTSGSKGFHVVVPLNGRTHIDTVAAFAHDVGALLVRRAADRLTQEFSKAARRGRIYVDTGQERLRRDVRGAVHAPRQARCAGLRALHVGGAGTGRRAPGLLHAAQPARTHCGGRRLVGRPAAPRAIAPAAPREAAPADRRRAGNGGAVSGGQPKDHAWSCRTWVLLTAGG